MAIELYEHNKQTYEKLTAMFETRNRVGVVQPTGTGKSFLYLKWIEDHPGESFAILAPSTEIFTQLREYAEASGAPHMLDFVQMISYQALLNMSDEEIKDIQPDKMILDEFHRTGADLWGPALQKLLAANPNAEILGASATPVRYLDGAKDMSSALFDRNLAVEMTLGEAVQRNILPTPRYVPVWYDIDGKLADYEEDIALVTDALKRKELEDKLYELKRRLEDSYGAEDIFQKNMPSVHGKYIVFCRDRDHLNEMLQIMPQWLSKVNDNVRSYVSINAEADKDEQLKAFKDDRSEDAVKLLFTIDRLNEGLHIKGIDGVIMLRPTVSPIVYLQQMGRALSVGHKNPVIFDMVNNYQNVRIPLPNGQSINVFKKEFRDATSEDKDSTSFKIFEDMVKFNDVFKDLEETLYLSHDSKWNQNFTLLKQFIQEYERFPFDRELYYSVKLGQWCHTQKKQAKFDTYPADRRKALQEIGLFETTNESKWEQTLALLKKFIEENGRFPKKREFYCDVNIGQWCDTQKKQAKSDTYPEFRRKALRELGLFEATRSLRWEQTLALLKKFIEENGRFPKQQDVYCGVNIGQWCHAQKKQAKSDTYPADRRKALQEIGLFETTNESKCTNESKWEQTLALLKKFIEENGRFPKRKDVYCGVNIGQWCDTQKTKVKRGTHPESHRKVLQEIGLFETTNESKWKQKFTILKKFIEENGRFPKRKDVYCGVNIGQWCCVQKQKAKSDTYPKDRIKALQEVGLFGSKEDTLEDKIADAAAQLRKQAQGRGNPGFDGPGGR